MPTDRHDLEQTLGATMARSSELIVAATRTREEARLRRFGSRAHLLYIRLEGEVNGQSVTAVVRTDCSIAADTVLLKQAQLVAALEDSFDGGRIIASLSDGPLSAALTLTRACDRVTTMEMPLVYSRGPRQ